MDAELARVYADELAFLAARLNRRVSEMESMDPNCQEFRDAVRVVGFLVKEISAALRNLHLHGFTK
jgi:hypothetical protein